MSGEAERKIRVMIVDDIPETREQIKKLLMFEPDFEVIGTAGTGREGLDMARETQPNIILMDINMPDMDGIQATEQIATAVPMAAVVMMSVQSEADYLRRAMLAGASDFLTKPVSGDDLYNTLRKVYERKQAMISTMPVAPQPGGAGSRPTGATGMLRPAEKRLGQILVIYSPKGGAGCTTIATNLASGLMRDGTRVLLVDADVQFGDVGVFLNLKAPTTLADLCESVDDLDMELVENVLVTHGSGLRVLLSPEPEPGNLTNPLPGEAVTRVIAKIASAYDFVIVDTGPQIDALNAGLFDIAHKIMVVANPTLSSVRNVRALLRLLDESEYPADKTMLVLNRVMDDKGRGGRVTIATELIEKNLKLKVVSEIPSEDRVVLHAVNRGVPVIAISKDRNRPPIKELLDLAELVRRKLGGQEEPVQEEEKEQKTGGLSWLRRP
jgi:pilus assembly protein CpaE